MRVNRHDLRLQTEFLLFHYRKIIIRLRPFVDKLVSSIKYKSFWHPYGPLFLARSFLIPKNLPSSLGLNTFGASKSFLYFGEILHLS